jgi:hypothetical protein
MLLDITVGSLISEVIIIAAIILILFVILKFGSLIFGLILNSILGLIAIFLVNAIFSLGITYDWLTWIVVAIFGLPAVAIIIILKLIGISI